MFGTVKYVQQSAAAASDATSSRRLSYELCAKCTTDEFVSAVCRRNTVEDPIVPKYNSWMQREDPSLFRCACDGGARPKVIDPCGYHFVGCKTAANAIRLHDEVVAVVAWLFRSLRLDVIVEPTSLFGDNLGDVSNQRPDIHIRNPRKSRQVIIDVQPEDVGRS